MPNRDPAPVPGFAKFAAYVAEHYPSGTRITDPARHAAELWRAALAALQSPGFLPAPRPFVTGGVLMEDPAVIRELRVRDAARARRDLGGRLDVD